MLGEKPLKQNKKKIGRLKAQVRVSNIIKHNGEFAKSPLETLNYLLDIISPASRGAESQTWAQGQLKYDGFPLWEVQNRRRKCCSLVRKMM